MIELKEVYKYYNSNGVVTVALQDINLKFAKGEIVAITGESGSGKSTLLNIITGMDNYDEGEIYYKGNETSYFNGDDMDEFRKKHVGFIFQNYNIIDSYTVLQNVMFPLLVKGIKKEEAKEKATELIKRVGLEARINNRGTKLSGGEKQRVVIARALASDCDILACDEPTGNLDSKTGKEIIELIREIAKDKLVLIVTHNFDEVKDIATRKIVIADGKVAKDEVINNVLMDENCKLDLDYKPLEKKTIGLLTRFNIFSTPRKTMLLSFIFFVISIVVYTLYQSVYVTNYNSQFTYNYSNYNITDNKFIVINNEDKTKLDVTKLENIDGNLKLNPFNELVRYNLIVDEYSNGYCYYTTLDLEYSNLKGELPQKENEALLIIPTDSGYYYDEFLNKDIGIKNYVTETYNLNVKGIAESKYVTAPVIKTNNDISAFLNKGLASAILKCDNSLGINTHFAFEDTTKVIVRIPKGSNVEVLNLKFSLNYVYNLEIEYEVEYSDNNSITIVIPEDFLTTLPAYEARLYTNNPEKAIDQLEKLGFNTIHPATEVKIDSFTKLKLVINSISLLIPVFLIYIVTFLVLAKVYLSKVKEYTIMRTLGIARKDMNKMVILETLFIGIICSLLAFSFLSLLSLLPFKFLKFYGQISPFIVIVFFVIMGAFSFFVGKKFAKKLFSKTSNRMLKEETI